MQKIIIIFKNDAFETQNSKLYFPHMLWKNVANLQSLYRTQKFV
jgi:hypothetical protein